ncbi:MAG: glycosyltransferase family 9 protein [Puniceicoccaceae bacterium]
MLALVRFLSLLVRNLPEFVLRGICFLLGAVLYAIPSKRRVVLSNLAHVYPERPLSSLRKTARINCRRTIEMGMFALASPRYDERTIRKRLTFGSGYEQAYRLFAGADPLVILLPHNYLNEMAVFEPALLGLPPGKAAAVFRPIDNPRIDEWIRTTRERAGLKLLSRRRGLEAAFDHLRACGHLAVLADQSAGDKGVLGRVAGRTASLSPLPDLLTRKVPARLVFVHLERTGFFRAVLHLCPVPDRDRPPSVLFADWLSDKLERAPGWDTNWLWMHRRWKTQRQPSKRLRLEQKRGFAPGFHAAAAADRSRADRFLLLLPDRLEELVMAVPLVRAIRRGRPDVRLTLVLRPGLGPFADLLEIPRDDLLRADGRTREGRRLLRARRAEFPDTAVLLTDRPRADKEMRLAGAEQRFGIARPGAERPHLTDAWRPPPDLDEEKLHRIEFWIRFLRHFGLAEQPDPTPVPGWTGADSRTAAILPGTPDSPGAHWPPGRRAAFLREFLRSRPGWSVDLHGTETDRSGNETIAAAFPSGRVRDLAGGATPAELARSLRNSRVAIGPDSGGTHLANALGCPTVVLFGPTDPARARPVFDAPVEIVRDGGTERRDGGAIARIAPEAVGRAVEAILGR